MLNWVRPRRWRKTTSTIGGRHGLLASRFLGTHREPYCARLHEFRRAIPGPPHLGFGGGSRPTDISAGDRIGHYSLGHLQLVRRGEFGGDRGKGAEEIRPPRRHR